jgi:muramoyltetrapeptide carboxypeptidase
MFVSITPQKLSIGSIARIVAPSRSHAIIAPETRSVAAQRFQEMGIELTFGANAEVCDDFKSSPVELRVADLHAAFGDRDIQAIFTVIGGLVSFQTVPLLDYDSIATNPKIICGYSDVTCLLNAIHAQTGLITYYGPHYSSFGMIRGADYTIEYFKKACLSDRPFDVLPSPEWSDDDWFLDQEDRTFYQNDGPVTINYGEAEGELVGGNIESFRLLNGTKYAPLLSGRILFLENDGADKGVTDRHFDRRLQSILMQPGGDRIAGLLIGRFKQVSNMTLAKIQQIVASKPQLRSIPVIYGYDFGHSDPFITLPIGGKCSISATKSDEIPTFRILNH